MSEADVKRRLVYDVIDGERAYQLARWRHKPKDDKHEIGAWIIFMRTYLDVAALAITQGDEDAALHNVRKVTALGVACMEDKGAPRREGF